MANTFRSSQGPRHRRAAAALEALFALTLAGPGHAQQVDRERAQMIQMQQQMQRLQSDNAAIQKERAELQSKLQEAEKFKKKSAETANELARARLDFAEQGKQLENTRAELAAAQAEIQRLNGELGQRDQALAAAAAEKRRMGAAQMLLAGRLKAQTSRGDLCEERHLGAMKFAAALIDRYEHERMRLCEPITGIWKVQNEAQIQQLRDALYGYRLDIPAPGASAANEGGADGTPAATASSPH